MNTTSIHTSGHAAAIASHNKATGSAHKCAGASANPGVPPLEPQVNVANLKRTIIKKFRLNEQEEIKLRGMVPSAGKRRRGISRFIRERLFSPSSSASSNSTKYRLLAGIQNELQQIARKANGIENPQTTVEVQALLVGLYREIKKLAQQADHKN